MIEQHVDHEYDGGWIHLSKPILLLTVVIVVIIAAATSNLWNKQEDRFTVAYCVDDFFYQCY